MSKEKGLVLPDTKILQNQRRVVLALAQEWIGQ